MSDQTRHIHLDLVGGLAGDMFLAAALDAGIVEADDAQAILRKVGLGPVEVVTDRVVRGAIEGTLVSFRGWDPSHESDHRHLTTIREMLATSDLPQPVIHRATAMFETLGESEAAVHGIPLERVHFHEVGAVDSLLDFVAAAWIIEVADATWSFSEIPVGSGSIETAHGEIPLPAPATARLLTGLPLTYPGVSAEMVTPTGATILKTLTNHPGHRDGRLIATGFGCGTRDISPRSNVVRLMVHHRHASTTAPGELQEVIQLTTEIDDQSPEELAFVAERLLEAGALDVVREPVVMKKGRLGVRLSALCPVDAEHPLAAMIFAETSTLGIRRQTLQRWILPREIQRVSTPFGDVGVKVARKDGRVLNVSPEYEECAALSRETGVPLRDIFAAARAGVVE